MANNRGNNLIIWTVTVIDVLLMILLLWCYSNFINTKYCTDLLYERFTSVTLFSVFALLVISFLFPPVLSNRRLNVSSLIKRNTILAGLTVIVICICLHLLGAKNVVQFGVRFLGVFYFAILFVRIFERIALNFLRAAGRNSRSILFIGSDPANLILYKKLVEDPSAGYRVVGYYSNDEIVNAPAGFKKLGSRDSFRKIMQGEANLPKNIDELYVCLSHDEDVFLRELINFCDDNVIHFFYVPRVFSNVQLSLRPEIYDNTVIFTNHHEPLNKTSNRFIKRTLDIAVSGIILLCMLPFLPLIAFMIKKQSPKGSIFFTQKRTGLNGKNFICYKFRSMHVNADADTTQATLNDPRKFPFGDFMRKTNIDEFPQFWNVLKGDMSIVGPRPHMLYHTEKYSNLIKKYMVRHFSRPGITGWAQVTGYRGETEELWQMEGRIERDLWYIENWSIFLDIKIILLTAWSIIHHDKNAY